MKRLKLINSIVFSFYTLEALFSIALAVMSYVFIRTTQGPDTSRELNFGVALTLGIFAVFIVIFSLFALLKIITAVLKLIDLIKNVRSLAVACMVFDGLFASLYTLLILEAGDDASYVMVPFLVLSLLSLLLNLISLGDKLRNPLKYYVNPLLTRTDDGQNTLN
ncbi:MAG: hypothetical protein J6Q85_03280 [Clostridia bacterium]|nr:hypothetical protein [Clostridia bacterium]